MMATYKYIVIGIVFFTGLLGAAFGEFIISSILFAIAATAINIKKTRIEAKLDPYPGKDAFT